MADPFGCVVYDFGEAWFDGKAMLALLNLATGGSVEVTLKKK